MSLVIEIQTARSASEKFSSKAWTKLHLFPSALLLNSGAWRLTLHNLPVRLGLSSTDLEQLPVYNNSMIYLRIANHIDTDIQSSLPISPANHVDYKLGSV